MEKENNFLRKCFVRFLKEKMVYTQFNKNFKEQELTRMNWCNVTHCNYFSGLVDNSFIDFCNKIKDKRYILSFAFKWCKTKEGHSFWEEIKEQWLNNF